MKTEISIYDFFKLYQSNNNLNIIDIRDECKYDEYHIKGTINYPCYKLLKSPYNTLNKKETYYIIDYNNEAAKEICDFLNNEGFNTIRVFGGIKHWKGPFE